MANGSRRYLLYSTDEDKRYHVLPEITGTPFNLAYANKFFSPTATAPTHPSLYPINDLGILRSEFQTRDDHTNISVQA